MSARRLHELLQFGADPLVLKNTFNSFRVGCKEAITKQRVYCQAHSASYCALTGCTGLLEFGVDPFILEKQSFLRFGVVAKRRRHQTNGPLPSAFTQLIKLDMLQGLVEFGADPFVLEKQSFLVSV